MDRFLRRDEVEKITSMSDPTMWREERAGRFPKRRKLTSRTVGWLESEIAEWMSSRLDSNGEPADIYAK
ncbi:helix-turn-helix transcriptional regulator [Pseudomonadota bacterium]